MEATLLFEDRIELAETSFVEVVIWQVPEPVPGSMHHFRYRLAYVEADICVVRFDNERGKGDHFHFGDTEQPYVFKDRRTLENDFWAAIEKWRQQR